MSRAKTTRQELEDMLQKRARILGEWQEALEELIRWDLQPPGPIPNPEQLSREVTGLCSSLMESRKFSKQLEGAISAIRDDESGPLEGEQAEEDERGGDAFKDREFLRSRLISHLQDALRMAQRTIQYCQPADLEMGNHPPPGGGISWEETLERVGEVATRDLDCRSLLQRMSEGYKELLAKVCVNEPAPRSSGPNEAPSSSGQLATETVGGPDQLLLSPFEGMHQGNAESLRMQVKELHEDISSCLQGTLGHDGAIVVKSDTDTALQQLTGVLLDALSLGPLHEAADGPADPSSAAKRVMEVLNAEEAYVSSFRSKDPCAGLEALQPRVKSVFGACSRYLDTMSTEVDGILRWVAWVEEELSRQSVVMEAGYPPSFAELEEAEGQLTDAQEKLEVVELSIKQARRRSKPTGGLEEEAAGIVAKMKDDRLDVRIMRERARLYNLARQHFPELLRPGHEWGRAVGLESSNMMSGVRSKGLLAEGRRFAHFNTELCSRGSGAGSTQEAPLAHGRRIFKATDPEGRTWALKEFVMFDGGAARAFWRHVNILADLRHPKLACVAAVFEDSSRGSAFLQMPWFAGGDLAQWLRSTPGSARLPKECKQILADLAEATEHLHTRGHVHCDIKPSNAFLTDSGRVVLGDFDEVARVESTLTCSLQGGTLGYIAPELVSGQESQYTTASDIYALGMVAKEVMKGVEVEDPEERDNLLGIMVHADPKQRPSASELLQHPFLKPMAELEELRTCMACWDIKRKSSGAECKGGNTSEVPHFTCAECLSNYVCSLSGLEDTARQVELAKRGGQLRCTSEGCQGLISISDVFKHLRDDAAAKYHEILQRGTECRVTTELHANYEQQLLQLRQELQRVQIGALEERALKAEQHVLDNILTLKCPRCSQAIFDFDGCFALKCARCAAGLCGWCLADCGIDAHDHVKQCSKNTNRQSYHGEFGQFEGAANRRRAEAVLSFLKSQPNDLRELVKKRIRPHLRDLGIDHILGSKELGGR